MTLIDIRNFSLTVLVIRSLYNITLSWFDTIPECDGRTGGQTDKIVRRLNAMRRAVKIRSCRAARTVSGPHELRWLRHVESWDVETPTGVRQLSASQLRRRKHHSGDLRKTREKTEQFAVSHRQTGATETDVFAVGSARLRCCMLSSSDILVTITKTKTTPMTRI